MQRPPSPPVLRFAVTAAAPNVVPVQHLRQQSALDRRPARPRASVPPLIPDAPPAALRYTVAATRPQRPDTVALPVAIAATSHARATASFLWVSANARLHGRLPDLDRQPLRGALPLLVFSNSENAVLHGRCMGPKRQTFDSPPAPTGRLTAPLLPAPLRRTKKTTHAAGWATGLN